MLTMSKGQLEKKIVTLTFPIEHKKKKLKKQKHLLWTPVKEVKVSEFQPYPLASLSLK